MSFDNLFCLHAVTFGGAIQPTGCVFTLVVRDRRDLDRQVIKSDSAVVKIPEIDFEIPPMTQKGEISTIEGFLSRAAKNLSMYQDDRMSQMPEVGIKVAEIICSLTRMAGGEFMPFTIMIDDIAGTSFIENPYAPLKDEHMTTSTYTRTADQDAALGLQPETATFDDQNADVSRLSLPPSPPSLSFSAIHTWMHAQLHTHACIYFSQSIRLIYIMSYSLTNSLSLQTTKHNTTLQMVGCYK